LPGSFADVPSQPNRSGDWGSATGEQMEFLVTWTELGLAPDSPFTFHVSSSNASLNANNFANQVDDNLSGCGGGLGTTAFADLTFTPDRVLSAFAGQQAVAAHVLTNTGNSDDTFDVASIAVGDFTPTISYYADNDASGTLTGADTVLADTNGDGRPDSGPVAPGTSVGVLIVYDIPAGVGVGDTVSVTTTAISDFRPQVTAQVTDTLEVALAPDLVVSKEVSVLSDPVNLGVNPLAIPGGVVLYTVTVVNQGPGTVDADTFEVVDAIPVDGCMLLGDIAGPGSGPVRLTDGAPGSTLSYAFVGLADDTDDLEFSSDGGVTFAYDPVIGSDGCDPLITHIRVNPKGVFAADTGSGAPSAAVSFRMRIR